MLIYYYLMQLGRAKICGVQMFFAASEVVASSYQHLKVKLGGVSTRDKPMLVEIGGVW